MEWPGLLLHRLSAVSKPLKVVQPAASAAAVAFAFSVATAFAFFFAAAAAAAGAGLLQVASCRLKEGLQVVAFLQARYR